MGSIGGPHSNDTRSGTPSGIGGGMQRQLSSDGLERPPSMGGSSCKDEGKLLGCLQSITDLMYKIKINISCYK